MNYKTLSFVLIAIVVILGAGLIYAVLIPPVEPVSQNVVNNNGNSNTETPETPQQPADNTNEDIELKPWKLVSGDPTDTCTSPTFEGMVKIKGWYTWDYNYVEKGWLFRVDMNELKNFPVEQLSSGNDPLLKYYQENPLFYLNNPSNELQEELKQASEQSPVEIVATKFQQYCEGRAMVTIVE